MIAITLGTRRASEVDQIDSAFETTGLARGETIEAKTWIEGARIENQARFTNPSGPDFGASECTPFYSRARLGIDVAFGYGGVRETK
ncbi:hypothetical protein FHX48_001745 [Microbacterium halimionae]|uniref:Uncharacterized protein n=1 Tax=Microbacterium halimionae TaxID=1526413 RepID=A0A7W3PM65_9MICO|nr:hypothetical protein [Microbacterium halimionae]NII95141.1 hypothetical protein [Microbacterium halimionae]